MVQSWLGDYVGFSEFDLPGRVAHEFEWRNSRSGTILRPMARAEPTGKAYGWLIAAGVLAALVLIGASCGLPGYGERTGPSTPQSVDLVELFKTEGVVWIHSQRDRHRSRARPLSKRDRLAMAPYFPERVLSAARVRIVDGFENPAFFSHFEERGEPYPLDLRRANAMALVDTILITRASSGLPTRDRLLFHELVHLMQYEALGLEGYMGGYVDSWAQNSRRYRGIPHEEQAFDLAARFWRLRSETFSVEAEVRSLFDLQPATVSD